MSAKLTRSALLAKAKEHGISRPVLMEKLGVSKQRFTNWGSRDVPPSMHRKAADVIGCSLDELLGRTVKTRAVPTTTHGYPISPEAAEIGWEWEKLPAAVRELTQLQISLMVAAYRRGEIPDSFLNPASDPPATKPQKQKRSGSDPRPPRTS